MSGSITAYCPQCAELRAGAAVGLDLLRQPGVRHDREPQLDEIARRVGERAVSVSKPDARRARRELVAPGAADAARAHAVAHDQRAHFGDPPAERRQSAQPTTRPSVDRDDEARAMRRRSPRGCAAAAVLRSCARRSASMNRVDVGVSRGTHDRLDVDLVLGDADRARRRSRTCII